MGKKFSEGPRSWFGRREVGPDQIPWEIRAAKNRASMMTNVMAGRGSAFLEGAAWMGVIHAIIALKINQEK